MQVVHYTVSILKLPVRLTSLPEPETSSQPNYPILFSAAPLPLIEKIQKRGMKAGVAISPDTPSTAVTDDIGNAADMILVMTVYPGKPSPPPNSLNLISSRLNLDLDL